METPSQTLHCLSSYEPGREWDEAIADPRVRQDFQPNDLDRFPWFYKRYQQSLPRLALPRSLPHSAASAIPVLAGVARVPSMALDLAQLSRLLHLSAGVVRTLVRPYAIWLFRATGSAGGRFPLEVYVAAPEGSALPPGVHWYDPQDHALVQVGPPPCGGAPVLVVTGVPWRTGWRYRERGFRHVYWDAGTLLAQLLALAAAAGLPAHLHSAFPDVAVAHLTGADGVQEWPVAVVALGDGPPALAATGAAAVGMVDAAPLEFPLVTAAQRAGECATLGPPWPSGDPVAAPQAPGDTLDSVALRRGSQRRMDPGRALPVEVLELSTAAARRGIALPCFVAVHDVTGLEPGIYKLPDLTTPLRLGGLRDELYRVCLDQALGGDAAFVVITATTVAALDDHAYREAQLAAGLVNGRLQLLAYALGATASGMTFLDSEIPALLGTSLDGLLFTCVGAPTYRAKRGGSPGVPSTLVRREQ